MRRPRIDRGRRWRDTLRSRPFPSGLLVTARSLQAKTVYNYPDTVSRFNDPPAWPRCRYRQPPSPAAALKAFAIGRAENATRAARSGNAGVKRGRPGTIDQ
ncbi:hypothetical protein Psi02_75150 [Planotetraspora silvatica]|uniref:Uncharacterized protein n=1 Tax=Planotetraspora silvatica TaxID=234614 RepID=A0A8J3UX62_9ACTN|nr:hypothetical protein Psi02_75150 [Planotetraspora silvatica]